MYLTGWAESPASAYVKKHGVSLMLLMYSSFGFSKGGLKAQWNT